MIGHTFIAEFKLLADGFDFLITADLVMLYCVVESLSKLLERRGQTIVPPLLRLLSLILPFNVAVKYGTRGFVLIDEIDEGVVIYGGQRYLAIKRQRDKMVEIGLERLSCFLCFVARGVVHGRPLIRVAAQDGCERVKSVSDCDAYTEIRSVR